MKIDVNSIEAKALGLVNANLVAKIELINITHMRLGGYNARAYSRELQLSEFIRTQSIKGTWRWWLRALLSGSAWELGTSTDVDISGLTKSIAGSTECPSGLLLQLDRATTAETQLIIPYNALKQLAGLKGGSRRHFVVSTLPPRLGLSVMDERLSLEELEELLRVHKTGSLLIHLSVLTAPWNKLSDDEIRVAFGALLIALTLQGSGAMTRRGFGHFRVEKIVLGPKGQFLTNYVKASEALSGAIDELSVEQALSALAQEAIQSAKKILGRTPGGRPTGATIPPHPSLSFREGAFTLKVVRVNLTGETRSPELEKLRSLGLTQTDEAQLRLLSRLGRATLKLEWKKRKGLELYASGRDLHTWVLGLPRSHQATRERDVDTGYFLPPTERDDRPSPGRRVSAISLAPVKEVDRGEWLVATYGFLSYDWPETIVWLNGTRSPVSISTKNEVRKWFNEAFKTVTDYLGSGAPPVSPTRGQRLERSLH